MVKPQFVYPFYYGRAPEKFPVLGNYNTAATNIHMKILYGYVFKVAEKKPRWTNVPLSGKTLFDFVINCQAMPSK